jgi:hypothetical protein
MDRRLKWQYLQLLAYWLDYAMNSYMGPITWRFPLAFQSAIALTMSVVLFFMPECEFPFSRSLAPFRRSGIPLTIFLPTAPRWLLLHNRDAQAKDVLRLLKRRRENNSHTMAELDDIIVRDVAEIKQSIERESETTRWVDLLKDDKVRSRRRVLVAVMIQTLQSFSGSTPINYYTTIM